jgi:hypothetical protein
MAWLKPQVARSRRILSKEIPTRILLFSALSASLMV